MFSLPVLLVSRAVRNLGIVPAKLGDPKSIKEILPYSVKYLTTQQADMHCYTGN